MQIVFIILLTMLNGLMAMAETALVSAQRVRLRQRADQGSAAARTALHLVENPTPMLTAIQLAITLIAIFSGALGEASIADDFERGIARIESLAPYAHILALVLVVGLITSLSVLFGEILPKRLALLAPEAIASASAIPLSWLISATQPLLKVVAWITDLLLRPFLGLATRSSSVTSEEINIMLEEGAKAGEFGPEERRLIERVLHLGDQRIGSLMVHRTEMTWMDLNTPLDKARRMARASALSHFPVCKGTVDRVVGVVSLRDLLPGEAPGPVELRSLIRAPVFVPESAPALKVLDRCRQASAPAAFVVDEYGSVQGEVTVERILDRLVGRVWSTEAPTPTASPAAPAHS